MADVTVAAFYRFATLDDTVGVRDGLIAVGAEHGVKGGVLIADEGINGTIAGSADGVDAVLAWLRRWPALSALTHKASRADEVPFHRLKVQIKPEIVTFKQPGVDPTARVGEYVAASDWNALIEAPDVVVIDVRNDFEVQLGTFARAINPKTKTFSEFAAFVDDGLVADDQTRIAMFCTGGIRCEKATSFMLGRGFKNVFHLDGGILRYLEEVPEAESRWQGECFVFDKRVTVGHGVTPGLYQLCHACLRAVDPEARQSPLFEEGVSCPACAGTHDDARVASLRQRQLQATLAEARGEAHLGKVMPARHRGD